MIHITKSNRVPVGLADFPEMVERKGKGHPDSVADECAEACSRALTKYYIENFDTYFHHNVDKAAYVAGQAAPEFGGGKILQPQEFEIIGRAIDQAIVGGKLVPIPVRTICRSAIQDVFKYTFRNIDLEKHVIIDARTKSGSIDLTGLYNQERNGQDHIPLANDTSFGVGFAPFSSTDQMVYDVETYLNSSKFKDLCPASGEDIKVMGLRNGKDIEITLCNAMVSKYVNDRSEYINAVAQVQEAALKVCDGLKEDHSVKVSVNTGDIIEKDIMFLTITGTSAEAGDDGQVGRGNRANGLITPGRVQTLEAAAGKNSNNHIGKLYSLMSNRAARSIIKELKGDVVECQIRIVSQIGHPINQPWMGDIELIPAANVNFDVVSKRAKEILQAELDDYLTLRKELAEGTVKVW
ncbi:S-adenosylmethionine synthase [Candidatus Lokiarchaeum ossiferum]|uniref:S-adenosylmethionine synthase n=1 Tax=Candidatus Lokiarchaeum ossiferum TaxID=2951803 RepID=A0ABY6HTQ9_9ARCH|nr:S-adenosylmethionine synthase [Candidatus Lokiarchaeum sp. B-35]